MRILFLLKYRHYGPQCKPTSSGLYNSVKFINDALCCDGIDSSFEQVIDGNAIDKEVTLKKPTIVILEAYWVTPEKLKELVKLHPKIKWIVRSHSNLPFFSCETFALRWTIDYFNIPNVYVAANNTKLHEGLIDLLYDTSCCCEHNDYKVKYLPNYYPVEECRTPDDYDFDRKAIDVGCFGALRLLKNQVNQAVAAIKYANKHKLKLNFHINNTDFDNGGPILANLRAIFSAGCAKHSLIEHKWLDHADFIKLAKSMDIGMQISYTETFNIVSADFVAHLKPVIVSSEVDWVHPRCFADPNSIDHMVEVMHDVIQNKSFFFSTLTHKNKERLKEYSEESLKQWKDVLEH